jgi:hypothetical protein
MNVFAFHDAGICRNEIAWNDPDQIAGHDLGAWNVCPVAVPKNSRRRSHTLAQTLHRTTGMIGLNEIDGDAKNDHCNNDRGIRPFPNAR